jgi:hypothetical protein
MEAFLEAFDGSNVRIAPFGDAFGLALRHESDQPSQDQS